MTDCFEVPLVPAPLTSPEAGYGRLSAWRPRATGADLETAFRGQATAVAIVTLTGPQGPIGVTATSVNPVSCTPPTLSFHLARSSAAWAPLTRATHVAVHLLGTRHAGLAARFTAAADGPFPTAAWAPGPHRVPILDGVAAWLVGAVDKRIPTGDQAIVVVRVLHTHTDERATRPLLLQGGRFVSVSRSLRTLRGLRGRRDA